MNKIFTVLTAAAVIAFAGCSSTSKQSNPLDEHWNGKGGKFTNKKFSKTMKWAAGQYILTGTINDNEKTSITKSLVVKKENGGWIFETVTTNKKNEITGMQMLIKGYELAASKGDTSQIQVQWIKMLQKDGKIDKIEGEGLLVYNMMLKSTWNNIIISGTNFSPGGAVTVPAGTFAGTTMVNTSVKILFSTINATSYMHPDVPINGVVKSVSDSSVTELIDFGTNGKPFIK